MSPQGRLEVRFGDNLEVLGTIPDGCVDLMYLDPPYDTGKEMVRHVYDCERGHPGGRPGFDGELWRSVRVGSCSFADRFEDGAYLSWLEARLVACRRVLSPTGSLFFHIGGPHVHYCKVLLDAVFGRENFVNEIIWAWDYGARTRRRWPAKHDSIFWYVRDPARYVFELEACDRIPYLSPAMAGPEKARRGKTPTDTWWHTVVSPVSRERTGYPTQKPLGILERIVRVHSLPGQFLCDPFAGSGSFGRRPCAMGGVAS